MNAFAEKPKRFAPELVARDLRCEYSNNPLGIDTPLPRLSWTLQSGSYPSVIRDMVERVVRRGRRVTAYQVLVASSPGRLVSRADLWDSGKMKADRLPYVVYGGKPLRSGQRCYWTVRTWDESDTASPYSTKFGPPGRWEMGLLKPGDWQGKWIASSRPAPSSEREQFAENPAPLFRKEFAVEKSIARARAYVSGLGYYELRLNGAKVGDHVLDPGWTSYGKRVLYSAYDVTAQLRQGKNAIGVMLGNGWFNPLPLRMWGHLNLREHLAIGQPRVLLQLDIRYTDGTRQVVSTDETWKWSDGPIRKNSVYLGEVYDARQEQAGWDRTGFGGADWQAVKIATEPLGKLCAQTAPPIRITRTLRTAKITQPKPGTYLFDLGQNFAGWARLRVRGAAGTRVTLRYGELLAPGGSLNPMTSVTGQIKGHRVEPGSEAPSTAVQTDVYVLRGDGKEEVYTPRFTFHGFRYVEVTGLPEAPTPNTITGLRLNSDVEPVGEFACSNPLFNRIQEMVRWTELSNLFSVQSDCPHREKFGYGGDIVATSEMAMLNFDMSRFYAKTVRDYADAQRPNGGFTETAPFVGIADAGLGGGSGPIEWGTAHPLLLYQLYQYYGDKRLIEEQYPNAKKWMHLLESKAKDHLLDNGIGDHETLAPKSTVVSGTAIYFLNAQLMTMLYSILHPELIHNYAANDLSHYANLYHAIRAEFNRQFLAKKTGQVDIGTQACQALALGWSLTDYEKTLPVLNALVADVMEKNQGHLTTGIFGTKYLLNALSENGRADVAYTIVNQRTFPGWGWMLENGATTLWEHWDYSDNTFSHNHPMFGSVSEWFYKTLGGIQPSSDAVGFDRVSIHPQPVGDLTWAQASYRTVRGTISTFWERKGKDFYLKISVPTDVLATVTLPAKTLEDVTESGKPVKRVEDVILLKYQPKDRKSLDFLVGSGDYTFVSRGVFP